MRLETERIVNLSEYESLIRKARVNTIWLKKALQEKDTETAICLLDQIDLILHKMEVFQFEIERRTITVNSSYEHQRQA